MSSRSDSDNRNADRAKGRGFTPPVVRSARCTVIAEQPTATAAAQCVSPARTRCRSSNRSATVKRCAGPDP